MTNRIIGGTSGKNNEQRFNFSIAVGNFPGEPFTFASLW